MDVVLFHLQSMVHINKLGRGSNILMKQIYSTHHIRVREWSCCSKSTFSYLRHSLIPGRNEVIKYKMKFSWRLENWSIKALYGSNNIPKHHLFFFKLYTPVLNLNDLMLDTFVATIRKWVKRFLVVCVLCITGRINSPLPASITRRWTTPTSKTIWSLFRSYKSFTFATVKDIKGIYDHWHWDIKANWQQGILCLMNRFKRVLWFKVMISA